MRSTIRMALPVMSLKTFLVTTLLMLCYSQGAMAQTYAGTITHGSSNQYTFDFTVVCGTPANTAVITLEYTSAEPVDLVPQLHLGGGVFVSMNGPSPYTYTLTGLTNCDFSFQFYLAYTAGGLYQSPVPHTPGNTNLPTELVKFEAQENLNGSVNLDWVTASEVNSDYVNIERTVDGINWVFVGQEKAAGNSLNTLYYSHTDLTPQYSSEGITYYRLKMVDIDGSFEYSSIQSLNRKDGNFVELSLFPNPAKNVLNMDLSQVDWSLGSVVFEVFNPQGKQVHSESFYRTELEQMSLLNLSASIYLFRYIQGNQVIYQSKVIKMD